MKIASIGLIVAILWVALTIGNAVAGVGDFQYLWNETTFNPRKNPALRDCLNDFKTFLGDGRYADQSGNRDRVIAYASGGKVALYTWVHCTSADFFPCYQCLQDVAVVIDQCCVRSFGIDIRNDECAMRYETYPF
ncbi:unnamed protein product [Linum trigynum]